MCGIAGIISSNPNNINEQRLQQMTSAIVHRGPEGEKCWVNETGNVGFGHRRLCIIDLSDAGAQPMHYLDRYTIVYNGEIYNYIELRETLRQRGYTFLTATDTEVILAAYDLHKQECLQYFDGMFAFALWDKEDKVLFCARDRFGEKPFYFHHSNEGFFFASEMKALWAAGVPKEMDNTMLLNYLTLGFTSNPANNSCTFFKDVYQLPPANSILLELDKYLEEGTFYFSNYWDIDKEKTVDVSVEQAKAQLNELLTNSVRTRLRSDVRLGTSLSGGLDSSTIAAIMKPVLNSSDTHVAFSAIFPGFDKDESRYINHLSNDLGISNYTTSPAATDFINDLEKLFYHQEEPFQSASIYAQFKVYELAKNNGITVLLDGQGSDEILGGYHKYYHWYWQELLAAHKLKEVKNEIRAATSLGVKASWNLTNYIAAYLPAITAKQLEAKARRQQASHPDITVDFLRQNRNKNSTYKPPVDKLNDILYFNTVQFGLQELLRYADRNSMAFSREVRLPFLNHELVQFIFSLPSSFKIKNGWTKWILRQTMQGILPDEIVWRKDKIGFEPPQQLWMQHETIQDRIHESRRKLVKEGILKKEVLSKPVRAQHPHEPRNFDWRYLCAANCI